MKLEGRRALITGANRGIGKAIAEAFAEEGAELVLTARDEGSIVSLPGARALRLDVTDQASIEAAQAEAGNVDILVNNAGIAGSVKTLKMDDAHWLSHLDVNLTGAFRVTRAFAPSMVEAGWGRIINIASVAGKVGFLYTAAYCASKHGLIGFTRALALEMATCGVTVNAICPGFVATDMADRAMNQIAKTTGRSEAEAKKTLEKMSPQGRLIEPEEVAAVAVLLASEEARGINGQALNVDGGAVVY